MRNRTRTRRAAWGAGLTGLLVLLAAGTRGAPPLVPTQLSYQGVLFDDLGAPRTGSVDLTLRVFDALAGGTLLYVQTLPAVALTDGVFSVVIGPSGSASDPPNPDPLTTSLIDALTGDLPATGPSRFLELTVGAEGALSRTQILTAPYALRADSAAQADSAATATTALTALDTTSVGGLSAAFVTEIFEHTNLDNAGPPNDDPREGLADVDGDGIANFVDPDNDDDGLGDDAEIAQGSDLNLVTPTVTSVSPNRVLFAETVSVRVNGTRFEAGMSVVFGSETPAPTNVTPTSFDVSVGPQAIGFVDVSVTRLNGESATLPGAFEFAPADIGSHSVAADANTQLSFDVAASLRTVIGGEDEYQIDTDATGSPETTVAFPSAGLEGQLAVAFDPSGVLAGLRCRDLGGSCAVELARDSDADFDLSDETGTLIDTLTGSGDYVFGTSLGFDPAGRPVAGYVALKSGLGTRPTVAHDRDGDGLFTGLNEHVEVDALVGIRNLADVAVDASSRVALVYFDDAGERAVELAWDRSGDGDYDDAPGGNPEFSTLESLGGPATCVGAGFAPDGDLAVVWDDGASGLRFARDLNADGDFGDPGELVILDVASAGPCDLAGGNGHALALAYVRSPSSVRLLVDRNDDGDFADPNEDLEVATVGSLVELLSVAHNDAGTAFLATSGSPSADLIIADPIP